MKEYMESKSNFCQEDSEKIKMFFQNIVDNSACVESHSYMSSAINYTVIARKAMALEIINNVENMTEQQAANAVKELVDESTLLRIMAHGNATPEERESIPGGIFTRMLNHNLSPKANELDRLALLIANSRSEWDDIQKLSLLI